MHRESCPKSFFFPMGGGLETPQPSVKRREEELEQLLRELVIPPLALRAERRETDFSSGNQREEDVLKSWSDSSEMTQHHIQKVTPLSCRFQRSKTPGTRERSKVGMA